MRKGLKSKYTPGAVTSLSLGDRFDKGGKGISEKAHEKTEG